MTVLQCKCLVCVGRRVGRRDVWRERVARNRPAPVPATLHGILAALAPQIYSDLDAQVHQWFSTQFQSAAWTAPSGSPTARAGQIVLLYENKPGARA